ncbi:adenylosuccinate synthetase [Nitrospira calida]|jgi:adenylosuccinate synthase
MPLTVVIGEQYGSKGKGKITSYQALRDNVDMVVRYGGPNSGHTVEVSRQRYELRLLPCEVTNPKDGCGTG